MPLMRNSALAALAGGEHAARWYRQGLDVQARLPLLSTFLGHSNPANTYWYLSAVPTAHLAASAARPAAGAL